MGVVENLLSANERYAAGFCADLPAVPARRVEVLGSRHFVVVHHTDGGMATSSNDDMRVRLREEEGIDAGFVYDVGAGRVRRVVGPVGRPGG